MAWGRLAVSMPACGFREPHRLRRSRVNLGDVGLVRGARCRPLFNMLTCCALRWKQPTLRSAYHAVRSSFSQLRDTLGSISQGYRDSRDPWKRFDYIDPAKHGEKLKKGNWYRPLMLQVETVNTCNNLCIICAYEPHDRPKTIMPLANVREGSS
jgi:hypothetical protein